MSAWRKLPTLRQLTARLRDINAAFAHPAAGPEVVYLWWESTDVWAPQQTQSLPGEWVCGCGAEGWEVRVGPEWVSGADTFDAVAAARRLLAAARDAGYR